MKGKILLGTLAVALAAVTAPASTLVVSPTNLQGWSFYSTNSNGDLNTGTATTGLVNGPATPPLGTGSAHLATGAGAGDGSAQMRTASMAGTNLGSLTALSYSTYATAWNGQQLPYLSLQINYTDAATHALVVDRLYFEPTYTPSEGAVALNTWQTWDALNGKWWSDSGTLGQEGVAKVWTLSQIETAHPDATIINDAAHGGVGGVRITSGFASASNTFDTYVDNVTLGSAGGGTTTYNFEAAAAVPLPPAVWGGAALLAAIPLAQKRRQ